MLSKKNRILLVLALVITSGILSIVCWLVLKQLRLETKQNSLENQDNPQYQSRLTKQATETNLVSIPNIPTGLFNYGGSTTWVPIRKEADPVIENILPQFKLRYTGPIIGAPGSGIGIKMLLEDQLSFSQSSRPLKLKEYQQAKERGFTIEAIPVAIDAIVIAVHPQLNLSGITLKQLQEIYTGKIKNWSQIGGFDLPITPYSRPNEISGTTHFFEKNVLLGEKFGNNVQFINSTTEALRKISKNQGGIYYASAPEVVHQCKIKPLALASKDGELVTPYQTPLIQESQCPQQRNQLNQIAFRSGKYPITRRLFVIVKRNGKIDEQAGIAYANLMLTEEGQKLITKAGFISIR